MLANGLPGQDRVFEDGGGSPQSKHWMRLPSAVTRPDEKTSQAGGIPENTIVTMRDTRRLARPFDWQDDPCFQNRRVAARAQINGFNVTEEVECTDSCSAATIGSKKS